MRTPRRVERDTRRKGDDMPLALDRPDQTAAEWAYERLHFIARDKYRGRHDTWGAARDRAAREIGLPETYAKRLWQRWHDMRDVSGEALIKIAVAYDRTCERVEAAADHQHFMREVMTNGETTGQGPAAPRVGMASAKDDEGTAQAGMTPADKPKQETKR